jgi:glycosyltransferase involved in cell wall biosynthesis
MSEDPELIKILTDSKPKPEADINLNFCIPPIYNINPSKINSGVTTWETNMLIAPWVEQINKLHALFVPSESVKANFAASGVKVPMNILPYPIDPVALDNLEPISVMPHIERSVTFLVSGAYTARKNYEDLLMAYCEVFDKTTDVVLVVKTWAPVADVNARLAIQNSISGLLGKITAEKRPKVLIVTDLLEDKESQAIIKGADVVVSTSRGEGLDLTIVQAMAMGKIVVCDTNFGHSDYVNQNNAITYASYQRPVTDSGVPFHTTKMRWNQPEYNSLCAALSKAYDEVKKKNTVIGSKAKQDVRDKYDEAKVVEQFNTVLNGIIYVHEQKTRASPWPQLQTVAGAPV